MQNINSKWNKFVTGIISNISWLIVLFLSLLTILFTQLGTNHRNETESPAKFDDLFLVYEEFGRIKWVSMRNKITDDTQWWTIEDYFVATRTKQEESIIEAEKKLEDTEANLTPAERKRQIDIIARANGTLESLDIQYALVKDGKIGERGGISLSTLVLKEMQNMEFDWVAEYRPDKILSVAAADVFSWILVTLIAFSATMIKIQGNKTGKVSGFKIVWKTTARHATLSEKIAPKSVEAEKICIAMNEDELKRQRISRLQYVALRYEDVFQEDGSFRNSPNFTKVDVMVYNKKGKTVYEENEYQKKLLKRQRKTVNKLKSFRIKEVHTHILLESKAEARERFDYGESLRTRDRRTTATNILTSLVAALPMFTAASIFVFTGDKSSLLLGVGGIALNIVSLFFNMFSAYDYIINSWAPNILKKCDALLSIAIELGVADEIDKNWDAKIEQELHKANAK